MLHKEYFDCLEGGGGVCTLVLCSLALCSLATVLSCIDPSVRKVGPLPFIFSISLAYVKLFNDDITVFSFSAISFITCLSAAGEWSEVLCPEEAGRHQGEEDQRERKRGPQECREEDQADAQGDGHHQQHQQGQEGLLVRKVLLVHQQREFLSHR